MSDETITAVTVTPPKHAPADPVTVAAPVTTLGPGPLPQYVGVAPHSVLNIRIENLVESFGKFPLRRFRLAEGEEVNLSLGADIRIVPDAAVRTDCQDVALADAKGHGAHVLLCGGYFSTHFSTDAVSPFPASDTLKAPRGR